MCKTDFRCKAERHQDSTGEGESMGKAAIEALWNFTAELREKGGEDMTVIQDMATLNELAKTGIHGYPSGDQECFCLMPDLDAWSEDGRLDQSHSDEWKYPTDLIKEGDTQPGTLIWIPDWMLKGGDAA